MGDYCYQFIVAGVATLTMRAIKDLIMFLVFICFLLSFGCLTDNFLGFLLFLCFGIDLSFHHLV